IEYMELLLAIPYIGAIVAPLNYRWSFEEAAQALELVRPSAFIFDGAYSSWALRLMESQSFSSICLYITIGDPVNTGQGANFVSVDHVKRSCRGTAEMEPVSAPRDVALICFTSGKSFRAGSWLRFVLNLLPAVLEAFHPCILTTHRLN
uniref:AMP-dependent synthetase/ligase domain-containing protein n=1 Tax=Aegilops tauschii subsp. strangulata TaxID=200361 RepID=A0A453S072_AEGTS